MRKQLKYLLLFLGCFVGLTGFGQSKFSIVQFSQHRPFINPAAITQNTAVNGAMLFRRQWVGLEGAPTTSLFDINAPLKSSSNYVGLTVLGDFIGVNQEILVSGTYAYKAKLDRYSHISFALAPSIVFLQSDFASINTDFSGDPTFATNPNATLPNVRFGAFYDSKYFFVGLSSPSLLYNNPNSINSTTSFTLNQIHYNLMMGYKREFKSKWTFYPSMMVNHVPGAPMQFEITGAMQYLDKFGGGLSYNTNNTISAMFNLYLNSNFKLSYAYSFGLNATQEVSSGSQEIMLLFGLWNRKKTVINLPKYLEEYKKSHSTPAPKTDYKPSVQPSTKQPYTGKGN